MALRACASAMRRFAYPAAPIPLATRMLSSTTTTTTTAATTAAAAQTSPAGVDSAPQPVEQGLGTVRDVLKTKGEKFYFTRGDALVYDAVKKMVEHNIGSLLIMDGPDAPPVGIMTEKDYLNKVIVRGRSSRTTQVQEIMSTKQFMSVAPSATLHECMEIMTVMRIRHVPVMESGSQKVLGMVSVGDIVSELVAAHKRNAEHMRSFIQGSY